MKTLQERINEDLKKAISNNNTEVKTLLRVVIGEMNRVGKVLPDDTVLGILKKMKQNAVDMFNVEEANILNQYLPKMMEYNDVVGIVENIVKTKGIVHASGIGFFMKELSQHELSSVIDKNMAKGIFLHCVRC
jgi:uncharacterized protein YqeY